MKNSNLICAFVALVFCTRATGGQPYPIEWKRQVGTHDSESANGVATDHFGNSFVTGYTYGNLSGASLGATDVYLRKYNSAGSVLWTRQLGTSNWDRGNSVAVDGNGNAYLTGSTAGNLGGQNVGGTDAFLTKIDSSGNLLWSAQIGSSSDDISDAIDIDQLGNAYITGYTEGGLNGPNAGSRDVFLAKFNDAGALLWTKQFGDNTPDWSYDVAAGGDGYVYVGGIMQNRGFLTKFDNQGNSIWTKQFGVFATRIASVVVDQDNHVYASGVTLGDSFLMKMDSFGNPLWEQAYGTNTIGTDIITSMDLDEFGNSFVTGWSNETTSGFSVYDDVFLSKYDAFGNEVWRQKFGSDDVDRALSVVVDSRGNVYVAGRTEGDLAGLNCSCVRADDGFLVKLTVPEPSFALVCQSAVFCVLTRNCARKRHARIGR